MHSKLGTLSAVAGGLYLLLVCASVGDAAQGHAYYVVGNPENVVRPTSGLFVLQGGGTDVDENFVRMGAHAGGGDFVVIRASGADGYNPYIYSLLPAYAARIPGASRVGALLGRAGDRHRGGHLDPRSRAI